MTLSIIPILKTLNINLRHLMLIMQENGQCKMGMSDMQPAKQCSGAPLYNNGIFFS